VKSPDHAPLHSRRKTATRVRATASTSRLTILEQRERWGRLSASRAVAPPWRCQAEPVDRTELDDVEFRNHGWKPVAGSSLRPWNHGSKAHVETRGTTSSFPVTHQRPIISRPADARVIPGRGEAYVGAHAASSELPGPEMSGVGRQPLPGWKAGYRNCQGPSCRRRARGTAPPP